MKLILDRINKNDSGKRIFVFEADMDMISVSEDNMPCDFADQLFENAVVECEFVNGVIENPILLLEETKEKEEKMKNRLASLFGKRKK